MRARSFLSSGREYRWGRPRTSLGRCRMLLSLRIERFETPVVEDEQIGASQGFKKPAMASIAPGERKVRNGSTGCLSST